MGFEDSMSYPKPIHGHTFYEACYLVGICQNTLKVDKLTNFGVIFHVMGCVF
jgi:hypothetical protein